MHVLEVKRDKLDQKVEIYIFLGYSYITKGYRAYNPLTSKMIVSKIVKFNKHATWNWETNEEHVKQSVTYLNSQQ